MQANSLKLGLEHNYYETLGMQKVIQKNHQMVFLSQEVNHKWELPPKVIQQAPTTEVGRTKNKSISQHTAGPQTNYYMRKQQTKRVIYDSTNCLSSQINRSSSNRLKKLHSVSSNNCINYESFLHNLDDHNRNNTSQNQAYSNNDINKGKRLFSENKTEEALEIFNHYLATYGQHPDALYLSGLCNTSISQTEKAIELLQQLVQAFPTYKRNAYILLAVSLKKKDQIEEAINILTLAIKHFNRYFDAFIYRGKMYLKLKQIDKAVKDFIAAVHINAKKSVGHMGLSECYKITNQIHLAIEECSNALACNEDAQKKSILIKRFLLYLDSRDYANAKNDVECLIELVPADSEVYYFKGVLMQKQKRLQDALLAFEQAIKNNSDKKPVTKSLYEIVKIKIEQNDFYQAQHELNRAAYLDIETVQLEKFILFVEGVIFLMKRKFEEGTASLTMMITKNQQSDHMKFQAHQFRAYGYFCQSKYHLAQQDLELYQENLLEKSSIYNKQLCYGIIACEDDDLEQSKKYFLQAQKMLPNKMEPLFYLAILQIRKYTQYSEKLSEENRIKCLNEALMLLEKASKIIEASNLLFYKGIVNFAMGNLEEASMDLEMAIDKSEDNQAQHYYVRGLLHCYRQMYREAINDFSICISLDQNHAESFLNRCKLLLMIGDSTTGYLDLQKYMEMKSTPEIDYNVVGALFYQIGAFEESIAAFNMYPNNKESLYSKVKVLIYIKELNSAISELMIIINLDKDQQAIVDHSVLTVLRQASQAMDDEILKECIHNLNMIQQHHQEGLIFKKSDISFYKSVFQLFRSKYLDAKDSLIISYNYKQEEMSQQSNSSSLFSQNCFEDFDFTNKTYNLYEHLYNSSIYDIMLGFEDQAFQTLDLLSDNLAQNEFKIQLQLLINLLKDDIIDTPINEEYAKMTEFQLFPQHNRLCSIFPSLQLPLKKYKVAVRLSFCLPTIEFNVQPILFDEGLLSKISPKIVENKPEAPWIKRSSQGVIFTENIQLVDDLDLQSTVRNNDEQDQNEEINNISILKEKLKLDEQVALKLNSIMKQKEDSVKHSQA